ncbi:MAG: T9SS type A sorting domain-containing protein [Bacteroidales bacterium]|nr:T9SS type A sorting domain-containing protein [Bacteroidales bacterium]MBN2748300.1 T9SS type A sorting domain-containing protein [Bacteroidales bacterium]
MKKIFIKSLILVFLAVGYSHIALAQEVKSVTLKSQKKSFSIKKSSTHRLNAESSVAKLLWKSKIEKHNNEFTELYLPNGYYIGNIGEPKLPAIKKLILVPVDATLKVEVKGRTEQEISLASIGIKSPLSPVQPSVKKSQDPNAVKFEYNKQAYLTNQYSNNPLVSVEYLGALRGIGIARVVISPVSYNPVQESIIVSNDIRFDITVNGKTNLSYQQEEALRSVYFEPIFKSIEKSSGSDIFSSHPDLTSYPVRMLIVANRLFEQALIPFTEWKTRKGFDVDIAYTDQIGTTQLEIKEYINKVYANTAQGKPAPTFLIIAGDTDMVPASAVGSATKKQTDLYYASIDGDYFPEMYYGRLSASTVEQMNNIISKILHYEQYLFEDPTYLSDITLIAGFDNQYNFQVGQSTIKYGTANYFNASKGFNSIFEFGVSNDPNNPNASAGYDGCYDQSRFRVGIINYTAHCDEKHWQDPELTQTKVIEIANTNHYPVAIGNCCLSGDFGTKECIGETWIRQKNTGAVSYIGSSPSTYWYEDFYWAVGAFPMNTPNNGYVPTFEQTTLGAYDAPFISSYTTLGAMVFVGNLAVTEVDIMSYPSQSSPLYYWQAYNILGDPSISPYFAQAQDNRITVPESIRFNQEQITIEALPKSLVALNVSKETIAKGITDETGKLTLDISSLESPQDIECVITKAQRVPFIRKISVLPAEEAYITAKRTVVNDAQFNNNGIAEYAEGFLLDLTIANYGETMGENISISLYDKDPYFSIESDTIKLIGDINAKQITNVYSAFQFALAANVPDQHKANIEVHATDGTNKWISKLNLTANAPKLEYVRTTITDSLYGNNDNQINLGETARMGVQIKNTGHACAVNTSTTLIIPEEFSQFITATSAPTVTLESITPTETKTASFDITINPATIADEIPLKVAIAIEGRDNDTITFSLPIQHRESITMQEGTISVCNALFYDSGGENGNYNDNSNLATTLTCDIFGSRYLVEFLNFTLEDGYDYLYVYDGSDANSPQVKGSPFTGNSLPPSFTSSTNSITFKFTSDQGTTASGWAAKISNIISSSLPSNATNPTPENGIMGYNSNKLSWEAEGASEYDIYFGTQNALALAQTTSSQQILVPLEPYTTYYWKVVPRNINGQPNANEIETWSFTTGNMYQDILMQDGEFFVDSAMFYDQGGPNANYPDKTNYTCTIYPKVKGEKIEAVFTEFNTELDYDFLEIYDGDNTEATPLGKFSGNKTETTTFTSTHSSGALTFRFVSDIDKNEMGWKAKIRSITASTEKTLEVKVTNGTAIVADAMVSLNGTIKPTNSNGIAYFKALWGNTTLTTYVSQYLPVSREVAILPDTDTTRVTVNYTTEAIVTPIVIKVKSTDNNPVFASDISITSSNTNRLLTTGANGCATTIIPLGEHNVTISKTGYNSYSGTIQVTNTPDTVKVTLAMSPVSLQINVFDINDSPLQDATITLNETTVTTNSLGVASTSLNVGEHLIKVEKEGFETAYLWESIKEISNSLTINLKQEAISYLVAITSNAYESSNYIPLEGSLISIYKENTLISSGTSNALGSYSARLPIGTYTLAVETPNYQNPTPTNFTVTNDIVTITTLSIPNKYSLAITVLSGNAPISKALITAKGYLPIYTNSLGEATFDRVTKVTGIAITVEKEGYLTTTQYADVSNNTSIQILLSPVGIETTSPVSISMYPNPASETVLIQSNEQVAQVNIFSLQGQLVKQVKPTTEPVTIRVSDLTNGMYIVSVTTKSGQRKTFKLIKK